jgi:hypothetical protein
MPITLDVIIVSGVEGIQLHKSTKKCHGRITIESSVVKLSLSDTRITGNDGVNITSGEEEIPLRNSGKQNLCIRKYWVLGLRPSSGILKELENTKFRKLDLFPSSDERGRETPTLLGPLERANLNHWTTYIDT